MPRTCTAPPSVAWNQEWAMERAAQAVKHLAENFPECGGSAALDPYQAAVHEAAVKEDRAAYEEGLREYMRAGRRKALSIRRGAA